MLSEFVLPSYLQIITAGGITGMDKWLYLLIVM